MHDILLEFEESLPSGDKKVLDKELSEMIRSIDSQGLQGDSCWVSILSNWRASQEKELAWAIMFKEEGDSEKKIESTQAYLQHAAKAYFMHKLIEHYEDAQKSSKQGGDKVSP